MSTAMSAQAAPLDDDKTLSAIRSMLTETVEVSAPVPKIERTSRVRAEADPKPAKISAPKSGQPLQSKLANRVRSLRFRPSRTLILCVAALLLVVLFPHVFVIGTVLLAIVIGGTFAIFGGDAVWGAVMRGFGRYAAVAPVRAEKLAKRMDTFALRWDGFLDRFPDGSVDGLYLPDFQAQQKADEHHSAVMSERLARMQSGAQAEPTA